MFDTSRALADMASQIRACRSTDGLTLQQLATRSGVAASTIHKVEAQQMVPTVSVLLKIAKGLGRRPEELVRDQMAYSPNDSTHDSPNGGAHRAATDPSRPDQATDPDTLRTSPRADGHASGPASGDLPGSQIDLGVWRIDLSPGQALPPIDLAPRQRAIVLVERGAVRLLAGGRSVEMNVGDCIEVEGGRIEAPNGCAVGACLTVIAPPSGNIVHHLGHPRLSSPTAP